MVGREREMITTSQPRAVKYRASARPRNPEPPARDDQFALHAAA